jgi:hypothetical protein
MDPGFLLSASTDNTLQQKQSSLKTDCHAGLLGPTSPSRGGHASSPRNNLCAGLPRYACSCEQRAVAAKQIAARLISRASRSTPAVTRKEWAHQTAGKCVSLGQKVWHATLAQRSGFSRNKTSPYRLEAKDTILSRWIRGFESRSGRHHQKFVSQ